MAAKKRFALGILLMLGAACSFAIALLPLAIDLIRVGPSTPGDANPVNIVDDFILGKDGGTRRLEGPRTNTSFRDFDELGIHGGFILLDGSTGGDSIDVQFTPAPIDQCADHRSPRGG
jgi:hypothetical protein